MIHDFPLTDVVWPIMAFSSTQVPCALHRLQPVQSDSSVRARRFPTPRGGGQQMSEERKVLERVLEEATDFLDGLKDRRVAARTDVEGVASALRRPLPERGCGSAGGDRGADRRG